MRPCSLGLALFSSRALSSQLDIVIWKGIHSRSDTNRIGAEGLTFYHPRLLYCPDPGSDGVVVGFVIRFRHQVSSSGFVIQNRQTPAPYGCGCMGHAVILLCNLWYSSSYYRRPTALMQRSWHFQSFYYLGLP